MAQQDALEPVAPRVPGIFRERLLGRLIGRHAISEELAQRLLGRSAP